MHHYLNMERLKVTFEVGQWCAASNWRPINRLHWVRVTCGLLKLQLIIPHLQYSTVCLFVCLFICLFICMFLAQCVALCLSVYCTIFLPLWWRINVIIRLRRSRSAAAYSDQTFPWTICRSLGASVRMCVGRCVGLSSALWNKSSSADEIPECDVTYRLIWLLIYHWTTRHLYSEIFLK